MAPRNNEFSVEDELKIIMEVERRQILWNVKSEMYKRTDLKQAVWEEVARSVGLQCTWEAVAQRFKNMKDTYFSNKRKVTASKNRCSGEGAGFIYKPKWALYQHLQFLHKVGDKTASVSNIPHDRTEKTMTQDMLIVTPLQKDMQMTTAPKPQEITMMTTVPKPQEITMMTTTPKPQEITYYDDNLGQLVTVQLSDNPGVSPEESNLSTATETVDLGDQYQLSKQIVETVRADKDENEPAMFEKRGTKRKKSSAVMEDAVSVLKELCKPMPVEPQQDPIDSFSVFVATRLRAMEAADRQKCEDKILKVLLGL